MVISYPERFFIKESILFYSIHLWLLRSVVPRVFSPVMCLESLKILRILRILKIWAALAMYSREYWEDKRLRRTETKKGRMPIKSITFRNEIRNSNWQKIQLENSIFHSTYRQQQECQGFIID